MIVTEKFIFIHLPKTGGTFVESCLEELYKKKQKTIFGFSRKQSKDIKYERVVSQEFMFEGNVIYGQHQGVEQIDRPIDVPIVSVLRDPFEWYASLHNFAWWKRNPDSTAHKFGGQDIKSYPNLSFGECVDFYKLCAEHTSGFKTEYAIGYYTWYFISLYFKNPIHVLKNINEDYIISGAYLKDMYDVEFINQGDLNMELFNLLERFGYERKEIDFIVKKNRVLPTGIGRKEGDKAVESISECDRLKIMDLEKMIFHFMDHQMNITKTF